MGLWLRQRYIQGGAVGVGGCTVREHRWGLPLHITAFHLKVFILQNLLERNDTVLTGHILSPISHHLSYQLIFSARIN